MGPRGTQDDSASSARTGVAYGLAAYIAWGTVPVYFKAVSHVSELEVIAHRVIWSVVLLVILLKVKGRWHEAVRSIADRRVIATLVGTTGLIALNWFLFIWAIGHDELLQASLGYFINPLINVLLGFVFLRERLRPMQTVSVALAGIVVLYLAFGGGEFPWIALTLATSFGLYGLLRKTVRVDALTGLTAETSMLFPFAAGYLVYLRAVGNGVFGATTISEDLLLMFAGVITSVPLLWFTNAAKRLRLATLGFLQYIAPTGQFLLAVLAYGEPFDRTRAISFACIWVALGLYSFDTLRAQRRQPATR